MTEKQYGPTVPFSEEIHKEKYRGKGESFRDAMARVAGALADDDHHFHKMTDILWNMRFLPAGRVQSAIGSPRKVTAFNCFVSGTIEDSLDDIMDKLKEAALTMKMGGGIGYDFSTLRPELARIRSLDSQSSGAVSFMQIYNAMCGTMRSAGGRRGAQMGVLRIDHPDIEEFIEAKTNDHNLTKFNISVAVTDEFMRAVEEGTDFNLVFEGRIYSTVDARALWDKLMRATWDWAEPGVLFIDTINGMNNLWYCETLAATNPCGEQPLPPYGACLLGSFNLVKYLILKEGGYIFDYEALADDIIEVVRAQDNIIDATTYPLKQQEIEAKNKRRMGLGVTGLANAGEALGYEYGSDVFKGWASRVLLTLANASYQTSALLAKEKGPFPMFEKDKFLDSEFVKGLSSITRGMIAKHGIRNSHLISFAPTGTISLTADNISSGIEPVFSWEFDRTVLEESGRPHVERVQDYGYRELGVKGKTADKCSIDDHLGILKIASRWSDSAVSKTINIGDHVTWDEFKDVYVKAWKGGCKGCTTFRASGKRYGILNATSSEEGDACYIDPETGKKTCE